ncbi:MAG: biopolymer transporter ExbD [candidate division KSB1 bacterium]|nr:biopolymer transporter ExbD [candidate division KSB1 bacterium]
MKFEKKSKSETGIPTASLPDIIFMLLIFFMVSTVFKEFRGIPVRLPEARKIEKLPGKRNVAYVYANNRGQVMIDDRFVDMSEIGNIMYSKRADPLHPLKVVSMRIDQKTKMSIVTDIHEELREADALNVNYSAKTAG